MTYTQMQLYAGAGFRCVRNSVNGGWITDNDYNLTGVAPTDWITKYVISSTGGSYTPQVVVNGVPSAYTPTTADQNATDWDVVTG